MFIVHACINNSHHNSFTFIAKVGVIPNFVGTHFGNMPLDSLFRRCAAIVTASFYLIQFHLFIQRHKPHIIPHGKFINTACRSLAADTVENPEMVKHIYTTAFGLGVKIAGHLGLAAFRETLQFFHHIVAAFGTGHHGSAAFEVGIVILFLHLHDDTEGRAAITAVAHQRLQLGVNLREIAYLCLRRTVRDGVF